MQLRERREWTFDERNDAGPRRGAKTKRYEASDLYRVAATQGAASRNPVIVIPGILGSRLADPRAGRVLWGGSKKEYARQSRPEEARLIAHPLVEGAGLAEMTPTLQPDGVVRRLHVQQAGFRFSLDAYASILRTLGVGGYEDDRRSRRRTLVPYGPGALATCFEFDYDWRQSLDQTAARLAQFIRRVSAFAQRESGSDEPVKVDLVAHSMGGLIARYMLRYGEQLLPQDGSLPEETWAGATMVDHALLVGTPNAGSMDSLRVLLSGLKANAAMPGYSAAVLGTLPAVYQLLPRVRHQPLVMSGNGAWFDGLFDRDAWQEMGWGLASEHADPTLSALLPEVNARRVRRRVAMDHLEKCLLQAERFHAAIDRPEVRPEHLHMHLFAGDRYATARRAQVTPGQSSLRIVETAAGDKRVLRSSAVMDERGDSTWSQRVDTPVDWSQVTFLGTDHMKLTRDRTFVDTTLWHLLEKPRPRSERSARTDRQPPAVEVKPAPLRISA